MVRPSQSLFINVLVLLLAGSLALAQEPGLIDATPMELQSATGRTVAAERGMLRVRENRRVEGSRLIGLAFVRLLSTAEDPGPPLIYLHGGPGGSATGAVRSPHAVAMWERFLDLGDVVLLDQRGCGRSRPALLRQLAAPPPPEALATADSWGDYMAAASRAVAEELRDEGVDITGYDPDPQAVDADRRGSRGGERRSRLRRPAAPRAR